MSASFPIYPAHTAVLSIDCQSGIVSVYLKEDKDTFLGRISTVLNHARVVGMRVTHVQVGFRPGLPEVSSRNVLFGAIKSSAQRQKLFEGLGAIPPAIAPEESEIVVPKHRVSACAGTDLAMILRASDIDTLVLLGIATSGVVLSTLVEAADAISASRLSKIAAPTSTPVSMIASLTSFSPPAQRYCRLGNLWRPPALAADFEDNRHAPRFGYPSIFNSQ